MHAAEQRVHPLGRVRELVLQQHLNVPEPGFLQIGQERWEAHLPRPHLAAAGGGIEADPGLLLEQCVQLLRLRLGQQRLGTVTDQSHPRSPACAHVIDVRVGAATNSRPVPVGPRRSL